MQEQALQDWMKELENASQKVKEDAVKRLRKMSGNAFVQKDYALTLHLTALAKSLRVPCEGVDQLRGLAFVHIGDLSGAQEALKEELRWFPQNATAKDVLDSLSQHIPPPHIQGDEFKRLYSIINAYTMVGVHRLETLYYHAKEICKQEINGNFVECGVAGGGTSGLLAAVLKEYDSTGRKLFACDSYSGMPPSDENDMYNGIQAEQSNWGTGTCAAPESSVLSLCQKLGAEDRLITVKGYFCDTLPIWKEQMGAIAFLHMDGDWYSSTRDILVNLYDRLVPGAFVQIDDYGHWDGCRKAVHEFEQERGLHFELHKCDGTGVWFRK